MDGRIDSLSYEDQGGGRSGFFSRLLRIRDGEPSLPAAAGVSRSIVLGLSEGLLYDLLRPSGCGAVPPMHRTAGCTILPGGGGRGVPLRPGAGQGRGPGLLPAGDPGGRGAVLFRIVRAAAASMGVLGRYTGLDGAAFELSSPLAEKFLQKNHPLRKKPLLFFEEMLYNKKYWNQRPFMQRR